MYSGSFSLSFIDWFPNLKSDGLNWSLIKFWSPCIYINESPQHHVVTTTDLLFSFNNDSLLLRLNIYYTTTSVINWSTRQTLITNAIYHWLVIASHFSKTFLSKANNWFDLKQSLVVFCLLLDKYECMNPYSDFNPIVTKSTSDEVLWIYHFLIIE
jgi:hypothetical protein